MQSLSKTTVFLVGLVALLHCAFFALEMFFWDHPIGRKIFDMTPEASAISAPLAMQQALYNGFLVAGLIWGLLAKRKDILVFFLGCVIAAGVFAALTVKPSIILSQAIPAAAAMLSLVWSKAKS
jgi:putative membrane protein